MPTFIPIYEFKIFSKRTGDTVFSNQFWMGVLLTLIGNCNDVFPRF